MSRRAEEMGRNQSLSMMKERRPENSRFLEGECEDGDENTKRSERKVAARRNPVLKDLKKKKKNITPFSTIT